MKKLIVVSRGRTTSISLASQLEKIFSNFTKVEGYCLEDDLTFDTRDSIIVISSLQIVNKRIRSMVKDSAGYDMARRVINHKYISELLDLEMCTEVLLVNDKSEITYETIAQLQTLGVNHIKYY